jgi:hypothetical protein
MYLPDTPLWIQPGTNGSSLSPWHRSMRQVASAHLPPSPASAWGCRMGGHRRRIVFGDRTAH